MREKDLDELSPAWRTLYEKGRVSLDQGDYDGAIIVFNHILDEEPGLVACREALRAAQLKRAEQKTGFLKHLVERVREASPLAEAEIYLHLQPLKAVRGAEAVLNRFPTDILAHKIFAQAALRANLPRTALLSVNFLLNHGSKGLKVTLELADVLARTGHVSEAMGICGRLLKEYPENNRVKRLFDRVYKIGFNRGVNALWAPGVATAISNAARSPVGRQPLPGGDVQGAIAKYEAFLSHGPRNLKTLKTLANLYAQTSEFDRALEYYLRARQVAYRTDPELENLIAEIKEKKNKLSEAASIKPDRRLEKV